jgi:glucose/arabinose dehydrogenase/PKD repeat protein
MRPGGHGAEPVGGLVAALNPGDGLSLRKRLVPIALAVIASVVVLSGLAPTETAESATPPAGFSDTLVANIPFPTALAFTPDVRLLITTHTGTVRVYEGGALRSTPALTISRICNNVERGLDGVAVDPAFASNGFIYLYYTFSKFGNCDLNSPTGPVNRVSRFVLPSTNVIDPASEVVLVDNIPSTNGAHGGGDLKFGKDGYLYVSVGDGACYYADTTRCYPDNPAARELNTLLGKILRITRDGNIPPGNPYTGSDSTRCNTTGRTDPGKKCQETFAHGLRNPWRMAFDPNSATTRFYINDTGEQSWEEIDLGQAGADYGWNVREGPCAKGEKALPCAPAPAGMTDPIYAYNREAGCTAITAGAFVPNGVWPATFDNSYLFADYVCGKIFKLILTGSGASVTDFIADLGIGSAITMLFVPDGATQSLYYATYAETGVAGQVRRVTFTGTANRAPRAAIAATPSSGPVPLTVSFNASGSSDPDTGDTLTYVWDFGDGSAPRTTAGPQTTYTYATANTYTASLRVRDQAGAVSDPATLVIGAGNTPPNPSIAAPSPTTRFAVGQTLVLQGSATDPEDGALPASALTWMVILHHNEHTHPYLPPTSGNNVSITAPVPEDFAATQTSYLEIRLTATDSRGLSRTISQDLRPKLIDITFVTQPAGLKLDVNGTTLTGPKTVVSWASYALNVNAPPQVDGAGKAWTFTSWSDGGAQAHTITTPASPATYTATFTAGDSPPAAALSVSCAGLTCTLDASASSDDRGIASYSWDCGAFPNCDGSGPIVTYTYPHAGPRTAVVTVTDTAGQTATASRTFDVGTSLTVLSVATTGSGTGTVSSSDGAIICGTRCSASYTSGTQLALTASPAAGSTFAGWSGGCSGAGDCQVTMDAAKTVTATFRRANVGVSVAPSLVTQPGIKTLVVTLTARTGCGAIDRIQFGEPNRLFDNAQVTITAPVDGPSNQTTGFTYRPPAGTTSVSLVIQRVVQAGGATVNPVRFYDGCDEWRTFVGGGPDAFK